MVRVYGGDRLREGLGDNRYSIDHCNTAEIPWGLSDHTYPWSLYFPLTTKAVHLCISSSRSNILSNSGLNKLIGGNRNEKHVGKNKEGSAEGSWNLFRKAPYDSEHVRHHLTSGLFEQQALMKYGFTPIELMIGLSRFGWTKNRRWKPWRIWRCISANPPVSREALDKRLTSGLLEAQILAKYLMTVEELMKEVGYKVSK